MPEALKIPVVDLSSEDRLSTANSIRQACLDHGFFYLVNHGVEEELAKMAFEQSKKFFSLPIEEKKKLAVKNNRGYKGLCDEKLDTSLNAKEDLPSWRSIIETYYKKILSIATKVVSLVALALNLDKDLFHRLGALNEPMTYLRLLRYPGNVDSSREGVYGASAHTDYAMITLLLTDGVPGLQACLQGQIQTATSLGGYNKSISGAFIVNIGDMMERWTNCLFRSTLHRVLPPVQERYSVGFFFNANKDCVIECLESCCSESSPPRFPPIRSIEFLEECLRLTYV